MLLLSYFILNRMLDGWNWINAIIGKKLNLMSSIIFFEHFYWDLLTRKYRVAEDYDLSNISSAVWRAGFVTTVGQQFKIFFRRERTRTAWYVTAILRLILVRLSKSHINSVDGTLSMISNWSVIRAYIEKRVKKDRKRRLSKRVKKTGNSQKYNKRIYKNRKYI